LGSGFRFQVSGVRRKKTGHLKFGINKSESKKSRINNKLQAPPDLKIGQINLKSQYLINNSLITVWLLEFESLVFICYLGFAIWDFLHFKTHCFIAIFEAEADTP
jgi:hypothetical protein